jgi:DNA-binding response OmpR family regulator
LSGPTTQRLKAAARRRLLVVDDNADAADQLAEALSHARYDVRVAYDGTAALEAALELRPDAALLDLGIAAIDGYEVAARLRATAGFESVFLVAITGDRSEDGRKRAMASGFDTLLVKPIDLGALENELARRLAP